MQPKTATLPPLVNDFARQAKMTVCDDVLLVCAQFMTMRDLATAALTCRQFCAIAYHSDACSLLEIVSLPVPVSRSLLLRWPHPERVRMDITEADIACRTLTARCRSVHVLHRARNYSDKGPATMRRLYALAESLGATIEYSYADVPRPGRCEGPGPVSARGTGR